MAGNVIRKALKRKLNMIWANAYRSFWVWLAVLLPALALVGCLGTSGGGGDGGEGAVPQNCQSASDNTATPAAIRCLRISSLNGVGMEQSSSNVSVGDVVVLEAVASGGEPIVYQWYRNGVLIDGAKGARYNLAQISGGDNKVVYTVKVSNEANPAGAMSGPLTLEVNTANGIDLLAGSLGGVGNVDGIGSAARFISPSGIVRDARGNVYVTDSGSHTIRQITPDGVVSTLAGSAGQQGSTDGSGSLARFNRPSGLTIDASGNLYVADMGNHTIRKISPSGVVSTLAGRTGQFGSNDGSGSMAGFNEPKALTVDASANLYVADAGNHTIRKITPSGVVSTFAGSALQRGGTDGSASSARFNNPGALSIDDSGNLYVADAGNKTIRKINPNGVVSTLSGSAGQAGSSDGSGSAALLYSIGSLTLDASGNLYVADSLSIRKITPAGMVSTLVGYGRDDRIACGQCGLTVDASGNLYVADSGNSTIRKVTPDGVMSTLAGSVAQVGSIDGSGSAARFNIPEGLAIDARGNLYVADARNYSIRKITPSGVVGTVAGSAGLFGNTNGPGGALYSRTGGLLVDAGGNVLTADNKKCAIYVISPSGAVSTVFEGCVTALTMDSLGNYYLLQSKFGYGGGGAVLKYTRTGEMSSLAGDSWHDGSVDGSGSSARFYDPRGLAIDADGNLYVADTGNHTIRKITPSGVVTTLAGSPGQPGSADGSRSADGRGSSARFNFPEALTVDASGNLYVADTRNHTIRKITPAGVVSTIAGVAGQMGVKLGALPGGLSYPAGIVYGRRNSGEVLYVTTNEHNVLTISLH